MKKPEELSVPEIMGRQEYIHELAGEYDALKIKEAVFGRLSEPEKETFNWLVNEIIAQGEALYAEGTPPEPPQ
jgi:hypothetical protein